jgi:hypothetical protein
MANLCSSSQLNGCANCGSNLSLFAISTSVSQAKFGYACLDESAGGPFLATSTSSNLNSQGIETLICGADNTLCSYSFSSRLNYGVDSYGQIFIGTNSSLLYSYNSYFKDGCGSCSPPNESFSTDNYSSQTISKRNACEEDKTTSSDPFGPPNLCMVPCDSPGCSNSYSCEKVINTDSDSTNFDGIFTPTPPCTDCDGNPIICPPPFGYSVTSNLSANIIQSVSNICTLSLVYGLCKSSAEVKISLLESNGPQDCQNGKCGDGKKDDCWGSASPFSIVDNNLDDPNANSTTSQKLKFKIAAPKEGFDKKYKSISGRVILYYGGTEGKTPCCDDDFDGTVVGENSYSISAGQTFKDDYFAANCGAFDNDDQSSVGETINICYTIDRITFI